MSTTAAPFNWYDKGIKHLHLDTLTTDDIRVALILSAYSPNSSTHEFFDVDITNEHATGSGYTAGGLALTTKTLTTPVAGEWLFSSDNPIWTVAGTDLTVHTFVLYNNTPASNKPLIGYGFLNYNSGTPLDVTTLVGANYSILVPAGGWFQTAKTNGV